MTTPDAMALARSLFGTDDEELMTVQQLLDWKALQALLQAENERLKQNTSVYRNKHAYQWHDEAMANLKAWHDEVETLKQQLAASEARVKALEEAR